MAKKEVAPDVTGSTVFGRGLACRETNANGKA